MGGYDMSDMRYIADHYGIASQLDKLSEEITELLEAINNYIPFKDNEGHLIEEIADVSLMIQQIMYLTTTKNCVEAMMNYKIERQLHRIDSENKEGC